MGLIQLRDYQKDCKDAFFEAVKMGRRRLMATLPTGSGKTILFSAIAEELNKQTLIIAHRTELIDQAVTKLKMVWPDAKVGIVQGSKNEVDCQIIVASVQTLLNDKRIESLPYIELLIADECHHYVSKSYEAVLRKILRKNTILFGVTATPNRSDGRGLGRLFTEENQGPVYEKSILEMVSEGYLSPIRGIQGNLQVELSKVAMNRGDYDLSSLSKVMNTPQVNQAALALWQKYGKDRKTLVFAVDIEHTKAITEIFQANGYKTDFVHGGLNQKKRRQVLEDFSEGRIQILVNCQILTEGYDDPSIDCVYLLRPSQSLSLFTQIVGRGLRIFPTKKDCLIIDGVSNSKKHSLATITDLFPKSKKGFERNSNEPQEEDKEISEREELEEIAIGKAWFEAEERQLFRSEYNWQLALDGGFKLHLIGGYIHLRKTPNGWSPYYIPKNGAEILLYDQNLSVDYAMCIAESKIKELNLDRFAQKDAKWRKETASKEQLDALKRWGVKPNHSLTKGEASDILDRLIEEKQLRAKKKHSSQIVNSRRIQG